MILVNNRKEWFTDTVNNTDEQNAEWKKPDKKRLY